MTTVLMSSPFSRKIYLSKTLLTVVELTVRILSLFVTSWVSVRNALFFYDTEFVSLSVW